MCITQVLVTKRALFISHTCGGRMHTSCSCDWSKPDMRKPDTGLPSLSVHAEIACVMTRWVISTCTSQQIGQCGSHRHCSADFADAECTRNCIVEQKSMSTKHKATDKEAAQPQLTPTSPVQIRKSLQMQKCVYSWHSVFCLPYPLEAANNVLLMACYAVVKVSAQTMLTMWATLEVQQGLCQNLSTVTGTKHYAFHIELPDMCNKGLIRPADSPAM